MLISAAASSILFNKSLKLDVKADVVEFKLAVMLLMPLGIADVKLFPSD